MMHAVVCVVSISVRTLSARNRFFYHQQLHLTFAEQPQDNSQSYSLASLTQTLSGILNESQI